MSRETQLVGLVSTIVAVLVAILSVVLPQYTRISSALYPLS